jgi:hypothetical protein
MIAKWQWITPDADLAEMWLLHDRFFLSLPAFGAIAALALYTVIAAAD